MSKDRQFYVEKALKDLHWSETQIKHSRTVDIRNALKSKGCAPLSTYDQSIVPEQRQENRKTKARSKEPKKQEQVQHVDPPDPSQLASMQRQQENPDQLLPRNSPKPVETTVSLGVTENSANRNASLQSMTQRHPSPSNSHNPFDGLDGSGASSKQNSHREADLGLSSLVRLPVAVQPKKKSWDIAEIESQVKGIRESVQQYYQSLEKNAGLSTGEDEEIVQLTSRMRRCNLEMYRSKITDQMEVCEQFLDPLIVRRTLLQNESAFLKSNAETYRGDSLYKQSLQELISKSMQVEQETSDRIDKVQLLANQLKACLDLCQE